MTSLSDIETEITNAFTWMRDSGYFTSSVNLCLATRPNCNTTSSLETFSFLEPTLPLNKFEDAAGGE